MEKEKITIGLDLGVGSVGWSIIDSNNKVVDLGSRLFDEPNLALDRRAFRSRRRMIRRKAYRNNKFYKLVLKYPDIFNVKTKEELQQIIKNVNHKYPNILDLKVKALENEVTSDESIAILHDYLENRGYFYEIIEEKEEKKKKDIEKTNQLPSIQQKNFFDKYKVINDVFSKEVTQFSNKEWIKEIEVFSKNQSYLSAEFNEAFMNIFSACRDFALGPGSLHSPSEYGVYYKNPETGKVEKKYNFIWDKTIGKCSFFPEKNRAPKNIPSAQLFNLLNQLNNLRIIGDDEWRLTTEDKKEILNSLLNSFKKGKKSSKITFKNKVFLNCVKEKENTKFSGYDTDKNGNPKFVEINSFGIIISALLDENNANQEILNNINFDQMQEWLPIFDKLCEILVYYPDVNKRIFQILELDLLKNNWNMNNEQLEKFANKLSHSFIGATTHNLSLEAINLFLPIMLNNNKNYESCKYEYLHNLNIKNQEQPPQKQTKYISAAFLEKEILPPSVKSTMRESIAIVNAIKKQYANKYEIENIVIEMAREKNSSEKKKKILKLQEKNEEKKKLCDEELKKHGYSQEAIDKVNVHTLLKIKLWIEQQHIDPYAGQEIDFKEMVNKNSFTEIDHIIPYSMSADDSWANKVLVLRGSNQKKGKKIPYDYFESNQLPNWGWNEYVKWCENIILNGPNELLPEKELRIKKFNNLTLTNFNSNNLGFLARNLNDTRYMSKLFRDKLIEYSKANNNAFKVYTLNGNITSYVRKIIANTKDAPYMKKDRNDFSHHAYDATILALISKKAYWLFKKIDDQDSKYSIYTDTDGKVYKMDILTGELTSFQNNKSDNKIFDIYAVANMVYEKTKDINREDIKFSRKQVVKTNGELFNKTKYGYKEDKENQEIIYKIEKINLITEELKKLKDYFGNEANETKVQSLLIYQERPEQYKMLNNIYLEFMAKNSKQNPFITYMNELLEKCEIFGIDKKYVEITKRNKIILFNQENKIIQVVGNLKYISDERKKINVFLNEKNKCFQDSFKPFGVLVYKDKSKKKIFKEVAINAKIIKFQDKKIDWYDESNYFEDNLRKIKAFKNIDVNANIEQVILIGDKWINDDHQIVYINGVGDTNNSIEYNFIDKNVLIKKNKKFEKKRNKLSIGEFLKIFRPININNLGRILNIKKK
ncbi:type II CRISPR RNA-guided endonuclease Cas9 [Metamycoplasma hyosynoviae]|uniref:type II CRISPR RNA-guided endonuclease Cas9 n=4 Tax=Metamycoplasma hyosynoviae TaxID=29559 RepID=UPI002361495E|nr:type II CRISPR RNA-guided endonuclease Cas9 [Metamycoplasma hyosynoviae]MDD1360727.1 type II CRISPR RNA-guided endonuclease Cas9 [Metamycoplasma hyosynoviae]MDD1362151.1 type II CRISPR RNA-guided endonuclease Cas9 [Metamycoplasma hyosynoviae]MDD7894368.1 type II CRISPR RNA-guided endonuclease Cas9 [Metamycoplasma hyosynoviae]